MPFKKLHPYLNEKLEAIEITSPTPFQSKSIPIIKSGANVFCIAPEGSGKTTTLILTTLQKLKCEAVGNMPRAVVLVENKEKALALYDEFLKFASYNNSIRLYVSYEQLHVDIQKSEIFEGIDILISTPTMIHKLFLTNGVSTSQLSILSIDDAEFFGLNAAYNALMGILQSIDKCQFVIYSEKMTPILERFKTNFMEYSKKVKI